MSFTLTRKPSSPNAVRNAPVPHPSLTDNRSSLLDGGDFEYHLPVKETGPSLNGSIGSAVSVSTLRDQLVEPSTFMRIYDCKKCFPISLLRTRLLDDDINAVLRNETEYVRQYVLTNIKVFAKLLH
ncbi:hypothetical protein COCC4DRAFT_27826 [Bipolaris maydis ATCC 48331]|uniref:Uncharacterized protein n=2 Tax=Cochliobolus heterostrophus TaxID=5016 RepID=M2UBV5_COCH5|nr:uncharacterized protein COCC4DRAFT_27826 [Bipolaris maydis ATCC 48331]EMD85387.1 hypothetical protein COCHEDRAFT_1035615 [Bipolaris maydis C5]ENI00221.1 hypothetical protein COCC4DRAFT_27826 [Bipolaris maydis ATCC 48331]KAH7549025.1 hypothetical protein BM1_10410 [Bipolaris maydis]